MQAAGTVGEDTTGAVLAYLSRLVGDLPSADAPVQLRSVHRAAFTAWARKQNIPVRLPLIHAGAPFTVRELLATREEAVIAQPVAVASTPIRPVSAAPAGMLGVGIDIEETDNLPHAADYREHPFFQDHFTSAEIAYCIRKRDARASFCGLWAAKEAILKSGAASSRSGSLNEIAITHDPSGRPQFPSCQLSISHTNNVAVAVCIALASLPMPALASPIPTPEAAETAPPAAEPRKRWWKRS